MALKGLPICELREVCPRDFDFLAALCWPFGTTDGTRGNYFSRVNIKTPGPCLRGLSLPRHYLNLINRLRTGHICTGLVCKLARALNIKQRAPATLDAQLRAFNDNRYIYLPTCLLGSKPACLLLIGFKACLLNHVRIYRSSSIGENSINQNKPKNGLVLFFEPCNTQYALFRTNSITTADVTNLTPSQRFHFLPPTSFFLTNLLLSYRFYFLYTNIIDPQQFYFFPSV